MVHFRFSHSPSKRLFCVNIAASVINKKSPRCACIFLGLLIRSQMHLYFCQRRYCVSYISWCCQIIKLITIHINQCLTTVIFQHKRSNTQSLFWIFIVFIATYLCVINFLWMNDWMNFMRSRIEFYEFYQ